MGSGRLNGGDGGEGGDEPGHAAIVSDDHWVSLSYRIYDSTGEPIEEGARQMEYLHGRYGALLPRLEEALEGCVVGDERSVYLEPDDAFGDYDPLCVTLIPEERLPAGTEIGMSFEGIPGEPSDGLVYTVTDIAQGQAVLDGNHPLAGISLRFELIVRGVRPASDEEIEHERREAQARD